MASIGQDILAWVKGRPDWQRNLLKRIAKGETIDAAYIEATAKALVADKIVLETPQLASADLPTGTASGSTVHLVSIGELEHINALLGGQTLTFGANGITVVYGDNGSGKSGYARLAKDVVGARIRSKILPDAYASSTGKQVAKITYNLDGTEKSATWPDLDEPALAHAHFYDEECGDDYLNNDTELAYRPSVLNLLDQLIVHIDAVRQVVERLINANDARALKPPAVPAGSAAETLLAGLSARTKQEDLDAFLDLPVGADEQLAELVKEVNRLKATDPANEKKRFLTAASKIEALADQIDEVARLLSAERAEELLKMQSDDKALSAAAIQASQTSFANEPLNGVGSDVWKLMWEAAERYSQAEAYPGVDFPATDNGHVCVLCQQPLQSGAQDRLRRFHQFVHNDIATRAQTARLAFQSASAELTNFTVATADTEAAITFLAAEDKAFGAALTAAIETAASAKARIGERLSAESTTPWVALATVDVKTLRDRATALKSTASAIDDAAFKQGLTETITKRDDLEGKVALAKIKTDLETEVKRLKLDERLQGVFSKISTQAVTKESSDLARKYVTDAVKNHFIRESERLKLEHVVLGDKGGSKGKLRHKPALEGAAKNSPREVLSEGEQTAAGLAGFFTEIEFDETKSAVVLDDPMSSLDHDRRDKAARRIVEIAKDRQVIVFTHDLVFLGEIVKVADELNVDLTERAIERNGARKPGLIVEAYPWKARDAKKRIDGLEVELAKLKNEQESLTGDEYERRSSDLAGKISETWERIVRTDIVNRVVDRGTTEVKPKMFRLLAGISPTDDTDFQAGYGAVTKWARRHDKSEEVSYTAPTIDELQTEIERVKAWRERVSKYA